MARSYGLEARIFEHKYLDSSDLVAERSRLFEFADFGPANAATQAVTQIEVRDPTADKRVFDFCFSIPHEQYIAGGHSRSLVRRAMKGRLPDSTLQRYKVGLQAADWYLTVGEALPAMRNEAALMEQSPAARHTLDLPRLHKLLDTWPASGYEKNEVSYVWDLALSRAIGMGHFLRTYDPAVSGVVEEEPHTAELPAV